MVGILAPLSPQQQKLVDLVAEAFLVDDDWPVFDYVEGSFDQTKEYDAAETLASFPRVGSWSYGAVWWPGLGQSSKPALEYKVGLTLAGMHHSRELRPLADAFFDVIEMMVALRRAKPLTRDKPRELTISDQDVKELFQQQQRAGSERWSMLLVKLIEREPTFGAGSSVRSDGHWTKAISRDVDAYEGVTTMDEYVARVELITAFAVAPAVPAAPSPLDLVSALDYLDAVWRVAHRSHLFTYPSAERTTKLAYQANTAEELDSRLSSLGEILRSANANAKAVAKTRLAPATRDDPLAPLEDFLVGALDATSEARIRQSMTDLEHALAMRDAAQHADAAPRAVQARDAFGIGYPIANYGLAWMTVTARVVEALAAIREELAAATP